MRLQNFRSTFNLFLRSTLNSYSQIFFSDSKIFASILLIVSFFDIYAGLGGLLSVVVSNTLSIRLKFSEQNTEKGLYGFNSLLVGLGLGLYFQPSLALYFVIFLTAILTLFVSLTLEGIFTKYGIPFLSIPFLIGMWTITLASRDFTMLGISGRGIYTLNEVYSFGGKNLVDFYLFFDSIELLYSVKVYFLSLGAIFFQYNVFAGVLIAIGLLIYSRIAFSLSIIGFYTALAFYQIVGADIVALSYSYIGFNFILTAIAVGGFFVIPSYSSYLWTVLLLPIVVIITISVSHILNYFQLSIYSLPFNIVSIMFIYILKLRVLPSKRLVNNFVQYNSPEKNLYTFHNSVTRFKDLQYMPISLPFWGKWSVSQAHDGEYTHQKEWKHAWDFVILDDTGKQFHSRGDYATDYYCYNKAIVAPADGIVQEIADNIDDNPIGKINTVQNWGNSIVIKHAEELYSQISHLKKGTFKVAKGQYVKKGQILANCGNSGRSPYPHLHFQLQKTPFIGSKTMNYPISNFIEDNKNEFKYCYYKIPQKNQQVSNIQTNFLLKKFYNLVPGQKLEAKILDNSLIKNYNKKSETWKVEIDIYKNTYLYCKQTKSFAYFKYEDGLFQFKDFSGNKKSLLYYFYLSSQKIQLGFYQNIEVKDKLPISLMFNKLSLLAQDFIAPFFIFLQTKYKLQYNKIDSNLSPAKIEMNANLGNYIFGTNLNETTFNIKIDKNNSNHFEVFKNDKKLLFEVV